MRNITPNTTNREKITFEEAVEDLQEKVSNRVLPWSRDIYGEPEDILRKLREIGIGIEKLRLDIKEFKNYLKRAD